MIKNILVLIGIVFLHTESFSQSTYLKERVSDTINLQNSDEWLDGILYHDSTYLAYGAFSQSGFNSKSLLLKINLNGEIIDSNIMHNINENTRILFVMPLKRNFLAITRVNDNNPLTYNNLKLFKFDENLDTIWNKTIILDSSKSYSFSKFIICNDSTIATVGSIYNLQASQGYDSFFMNLDTNGNILFENYLSAIGSSDGSFTIDQTFDDGFIIGGYTNQGHPLNGSYSYLKKTDRFGNLQWYSIIGSSLAPNGSIAVLNLPDSTFFAFRLKYINGNYPEYNYKSSISKYNYNGSVIWTKDYGVSGESIYTNFIPFKVIGDSAVFAIRHDASSISPQFVNISLEGDLIFERKHRVLAGEHNGTLHSGIHIPLDGGFLFSGLVYPNSTNPGPWHRDIFVIKTNCIGFADPPFASATTSSLNNFEVVLENNSMYFGNCFIDWGDGNFDTLYESSDTLIYHNYGSAGNFNATIIAEACGDTDTIQLNVASSLVGVEVHQKKSFRVYPNPANGILNIRMENTILNYEIILSDITGKVILRKEDCTSIDVSDFSDGIYFISIPQLNSTEKIQILR